MDLNDVFVDALREAGHTARREGGKPIIEWELHPHVVWKAWNIAAAAVGEPERDFGDWTQWQIGDDAEWHATRNEWFAFHGIEVPS